MLACNYQAIRYFKDPMTKNKMAKNIKQNTVRVQLLHNTG